MRERYENTPEAAKALNNWSRHEMIHKLLADILCDMEICRLEGWSTKEYIKILKKEIDNIYNKFKEDKK